LADIGEHLLQKLLLCSQCLKLDTLLSEVTFQLSCKSLEITLAQIVSLPAIQVMPPIVTQRKKCVPPCKPAIPMDIARMANAFATVAMPEQTVEKKHFS
jgi:hypothetical protein